MAWKFWYQFAGSTRTGCGATGVVLQGVLLQVSVEHWVLVDIVLLQCVCRTLGISWQCCYRVSVKYWVSVDSATTECLSVSWTLGTGRHCCYRVSVEQCVPVDTVLLQGVCRTLGTGWHSAATGCLSNKQPCCLTDWALAIAAQTSGSTTYRIFKPQRKQPIHNTHYAAGSYYRWRTFDVTPDLPTTHPCSFILNKATLSTAKAPYSYCDGRLTAGASVRHGNAILPWIARYREENGFVGRSVPLVHAVLNFWRRDNFFILAHPVYKIWITQEPNTLDLWNKLHFEEKKTEIIYNV